MSLIRDQLAISNGTSGVIDLSNAEWEPLELTEPAPDRYELAGEGGRPRGRRP